MKYYLDALENAEWHRVYCKSNNPLDIVKTLLDHICVRKFNVANYQPEDEWCCIKNDSNLYIAETLDGKKEIWQVGGRMSDYNGVIVPDVYLVRLIGGLIE